MASQRGMEIRRMAINIFESYSEAAELARRYDSKARAYYNRKMQKANFMVAHASLSHKLAKAGYYIMRNCIPFNPEKLFG